jgi:hypothetical protein
MKLRNLFIILIFSLSFAACKSSKTTTDTDVKEMTYQELAKEKFGDVAQMDFLLNKSKNFVVCTAAKDTYIKNPYNGLKFFIYAIETKEIIFEDKLAGGTVEWVSGTEVKVKWTPTKEKDALQPEKTSYLYDVKNKKKIGGKTSNK